VCVKELILQKAPPKPSKEYSTLQTVYIAKFKYMTSLT